MVLLDGTAGLKPGCEAEARFWDGGRGTHHGSGYGAPRNLRRGDPCLPRPHVYAAIKLAGDVRGGSELGGLACAYPPACILLSCSWC